VSDWEEGYAAGASMSHSLGCDAVAAQRDQLLEDVAARQASAALHHFLTEWSVSLRHFEDAERRYDAVVEEWRARRPGEAVNAEHMAASDPRLLKASRHCIYFGDRAVVYGISALLEIVRGEQP